MLLDLCINLRYFFIICQIMVYFAPFLRKFESFIKLKFRKFKNLLSVNK